MRTKTLYAPTPGGHIAYQVHGSGPPDLIVVPNWITHVEAMWEIPAIAHGLTRLASWSRFVVYDQLGTGLSDPVPLADLPTLEERVDEVRAVMDAAGIDRAAIFGNHSGGRVAPLFAATNPERVTNLILADVSPRAWGNPEDPSDPTPAQTEAALNAILDSWGTPPEGPPGAETLEQERWAWYQRQAASPGVARAMVKMTIGADVTGILPAVRVPTLVLFDPALPLPPGDDRPVDKVRRRSAEVIARLVPNATLQKVRSEGHSPGDLSVYFDATRAFITGTSVALDVDRVLSTLLFTDIVSSTETAAKLGDLRWRELLDAHDEMIRRQVDRFRGREIKTLGDGFLAAFDGPARGIRCAQAAVEGALRLGLELRAGLHTGECEVRGEDLGGIAVHVAARVMAVAGPGEIVVSGTVRDLVAGSGIRFEDRGSHTFKGVPDEWRVYTVEP